MINIKCTEECSGCSACAAVCPQNCISMISDQEGFSYPYVDMNKCIACGKCKEICPIHNPVSAGGQEPQAYAAWNLCDEVRIKSSSGGLFSLLAENILREGGVVFGAAFTEDFRSVHHIKVETTADLARLRGSKYVQSSIENSYVETKKYLEAGRPVLFTGTPCQIGGLRAYLRQNYPHLYTQDFICHGVPSPKAWAKYVDYRETEAAATTKSVFFRHKQSGWKTFSVQFAFSNHMEYIQSLKKDLYMRGFLNDLYLRPSCHHCMYKGVYRAADITLADFWGIERLMPEMDDDKGTSLVLIHSEKGKHLFEMLKEQIKYSAVDLKSAVASNSAAVLSVKTHPKRDVFFADLERKPFAELVSRCLYRSPYVRAKSLMNRIAAKLKRILNFRRTP